MKLRPRLDIQISKFPKLHAAVHQMHERDIASFILNLAEEALRMREIFVMSNPSPKVLTTSSVSDVETNSIVAVQPVASEMDDSPLRSDLKQASRVKSRSTFLRTKIATS